MEGTLGGRPGRRPRQFFEHEQENDVDDFKKKQKNQRGSWPESGLPIALEPSLSSSPMFQEILVGPGE